MKLMDGVGCVFRELDAVFRHIYSVNTVVLHGLEFCENSNELIFIQGVLLGELKLILVVVRLLERVVILECYMLQTLFFLTLEWFVMNSRDIMGTRRSALDLALCFYFGRDEIEIRL